MTNIPAEDVVFQQAGTYKVRSQAAHTPTTWYMVDITTGICECIDGRSGKQCKHQSAVIVHNQLTCERLYNGTPEEKVKLAALALGKAPPLSFFSRSVASEEFEAEEVSPTMHELLPTSSSQEVSSMDIPCTSHSQDQPSTDIPSSTSQSSQDMSSASQEVEEDLTETNTQLMKNLMELMMKKFGGHLKSKTAESAITAMINNTARIRTPAQMESCCHTFNSSTYYSSSSRKIPVQPANRSKRAANLPRSAAPLQAGRRPKGVTVSRKRPHDLAMAVDNNHANAKKH